MFSGKTLLITGGTGTFGNAVLQRFLSTNVEQIRIFSRDEKKQDDMRKKYNSSKLRFYIGDVRNFQSINDAMSGVNYVFHAAALKQVPSCEFYPMEALLTNTLGAENVINASIANNIEKLIVLSTDKAVYPINVMGLTKSLMEKIMIAKSRIAIEKNIIFCGTRYGNVMCSRGSVIPYFINQIKNNCPITITDPNMTRFMMSIDDAVDLVIFAFINASSGDIFVHKAPSCTIHNLAIALKELFNSNNSIEIIGTRHGEKLYETLVTREEMSRAEDLDKYIKIRADNRNLNYDMYFSKGNLSISTIEDYNSNNVIKLSIEEMKQIIVKIPFVKRELSGLKDEEVNDELV